MQTAVSLLAKLQNTRKAIYLDTEHPLPDDIKKLRQAHFKECIDFVHRMLMCCCSQNEYKLRQVTKPESCDD
eukprot:355150-Chlamydomonas_euryale.AAC.3